MTVPPLIPQPAHVAEREGRVTIADRLRIEAAPGLEGVARWFRRTLEPATGWRIDVADAADGADSVGSAGSGPAGAGAPTIRLSLADDPRLAQSSESYVLEIDSAANEVEIAARSAAGAFYGLQTLRQMLPDSAWRSAPPAGGHPPIDLQAVEIVDGPAYRWRGVHLDVSRHFMPKPFVLRLIDAIAAHKCNVLHLHLTDDQGWRVPISRYPRLTEIGAWRRCSPGEREPHGGFYTAEDLGEIVAYAGERAVEVVPEIDMPGHMLAAIAAYPELGNDPPGSPAREVHCEWGISEHVLNLEEPTIRFCTEVLDEIGEIFPSRYVHIGGDECPVEEWRASAPAQQLMRQHGFTTERQLQGWFTGRIVEHLAGRGKVAVGWDEILEGGAPPHAVVMSWRSEEGGIEAAAAGHDVVMAPQQWLYFDWASEHGEEEPRAIWAATTLERVYSYRPTPSEIPEGQADHVLGAQCQLWTEYVRTPEHAEYMYFPRVCAFSEAVWAPVGEERDYAGFERRLEGHLGRLAAMGLNYRPLAGPTPGQQRLWRPPVGAHER